MRRWLPKLAALLATAICVSAVTPIPAAAGGPTSVLIVDTDAGRATALYVSDADYSTLDGLLGSGTPGPGAEDDLTEAESARRWAGPMTTITWLIHDVNVWRVDRILPGGSDGPWIHTTTSMNGGALDQEDGWWHQPDDQEALDALLDRLLTEPATLDPAAARSSSAPSETTSPAPATSDITPSPAAVAAASPAVSPGWSPGIALIIGLAVGAVVALVVARWVGRRSG